MSRLSPASNIIYLCAISSATGVEAFQDLLPFAFFFASVELIIQSLSICLILPFHVRLVLLLLLLLFLSILTSHITLAILLSPNLCICPSHLIYCLLIVSNISFTLFYCFHFLFYLSLLSLVNFLIFSLRMPHTSAITNHTHGIRQHCMFKF